MALFKKKNKTNVKAGKKVEYERDYDDEIENNTSEAADNVTEEEHAGHSDIQQLVNVNMAAKPENILGLIRNSFFLDEDDSSMDNEIFSMTKRQVIDRLLEMQDIYGKTDYICSIIEAVCKVNLNLDMTKRFTDDLPRSEYKDEPYTGDSSDDDMQIHYHEDTYSGHEDMPDEAYDTAHNDTKSTANNIDYEAPEEEESFISDSADEQEEINIILEIIDYDGTSKLYLMSELTEDEDLEILDMLSEVNYDKHIKNFYEYLESCGAVLSDGSEYSADDIYVTYNAITNEVI